MNRRRILSGIHTTIARKQAQGVNAAAWFNTQSFHQSAADLSKLSIKQLDEAGAGLLPTSCREVCPDCCGTREIHRVDGATVECGECSGRGYLEGER